MAELVPLSSEVSSTSNPNRAVSASADLWVLNDDEEDAVLWTMQDQPLHKGSGSPLTQRRDVVRHKIGEGTLGQVALTGEVVVDDADPYSAAYYVPVRKAIPSEILGVLQVAIGVGTGFSRSFGSPNAFTGSRPPSLFARSALSESPGIPDSAAAAVAESLAIAKADSAALREVLLTASKHVARAMHRVMQTHMHTSLLATTGSSLALTQNRLDVASKSYNRLRHQLRVERGLVRCISAIATWPRKEIQAATDDEEWIELFHIAEDLVREVLLGESGSANTDVRDKDEGGVVASARRGYEQCRFYVYDAQQERFWRLRGLDREDDAGREEKERNLGHNATTLLPSSRHSAVSDLFERNYYDATSAHIASTLVSGLPLYNTTIPEICLLPVNAGDVHAARSYGSSSLNDLTHLIVPVMDSDRSLVGALEIARPALPLPNSMKKSVSVLSDYGAQIALAMGRMRQRQSARRVHAESLQRLEWSRRRGGLLLAVENLWNGCSREDQALQFFEERRRV